MDNCELFLHIPGIIKQTDIFIQFQNSSLCILRARTEVAIVLENIKKYEWIHKPRIFTFPDMQEVCETEITIVVRDE